MPRPRTRETSVTELEPTDPGNTTFKPFRSARKTVPARQIRLSEPPRRVGSDAEDNDELEAEIDAQLQEEISQHQKRLDGGLNQGRLFESEAAAHLSDGVLNRVLHNKRPLSEAAELTHQGAAKHQKLSEKAESFAKTPIQNLSSLSPEQSPSKVKSHTVSKTPGMHLTPQEKKDRALDLDVIDRFEGVRHLSLIFCRKHFGNDFTIKDDLKTLVKSLPWETISYIGCVADGGPQGEAGWTELLELNELRVAVIFGIIQRVIKEHVYGSLMFGAPDDLMQILTDMEQSQMDADGFVRTETRAQIITSYELAPNKGKITQNRSYGTAIMNLTLALEVMLEPIAKLNPRFNDEEGLYLDLVPIITEAAELAGIMRRNGETVLYHLMPVFKDQDYEPESMVHMNPNQLREDVNNVPQEDPCLIKVVGSLMLVAYRAGGGVMAERILEKEEKEVDYSVAPELRHRPRNEYRGRIITAKDGYRTRMLAKALVACRFGQPRYIEVDSKEDAYGNKYLNLMDIVDKDPEKRCGVM